LVYCGIDTPPPRGRWNSIRAIPISLPGDISALRVGDRVALLGGINNEEASMRTKVMGIIALGALILAVIVSVSPHATIVANEISGEVYAIDILGLTTNAQDLPVQQYAAH
jgi:hypothetical protein